MKPRERKQPAREQVLVYYTRKSSNAKGSYRYYACGRRQSHGPEACDNKASVREDKLMARIQAAMSAVFDDMDVVLDEVAAMAGEALEANRTETTRLKGEIAETDKFVANLTRVLVDPDIEAGAKKAVARPLAEQEAKREELRKALDGVAVQAALDMDDLMADCRQAFLEAKANFAGLMTPAQVNRFVAEVVGPMTVLPDGRVVQEEAAATGEVAAAGKQTSKSVAGNMRSAMGGWTPGAEPSRQFPAREGEKFRSRRACRCAYYSIFDQES
ncbi:MAG TPA: zinc ribbon domain-containing protein [Phycisphaerae bacterium]|nr:zinc ribbon domain-containing protein [Phycisphaerae bacterium]